jgi:hypothetical protein
VPLAGISAGDEQSSSLQRSPLLPTLARSSPQPPCLPTRHTYDLGDDAAEMVGQLSENSHEPCR